MTITNFFPANYRAPMVYTLMFEPQGLMRTNFAAAGNFSEHGDRLRWRIGNAHRLSLTTDHWPLATACQRPFRPAHWVRPAKTQQLRPRISVIPRRDARWQAPTSQMRVMRVNIGFSIYPKGSGWKFLLCPVCLPRIITTPKTSSALLNCATKPVAADVCCSLSRGGR